MSIELNTLAPKKWVANYSGVRPTIDSSNGVHIGDYTIDSSTTPNYIWVCEDDTTGTPLWTRSVMMDVASISSTPYTAKVTDQVILANCSAATITVNLPASSGLIGKQYNIKKVDSSTNPIIVDANGTEKIDLESTKNVSGQNSSMAIVCDGQNWNII